MNDPNGMFVDAEGLYHLYYQCQLHQLSLLVQMLPLAHRNMSFSYYATSSGFHVGSAAREECVDLIGLGTLFLTTPITSGYSEAPVFDVCCRAN